MNEAKDNQLNLFAAQKKRDEAVALVHAGADADWFEHAVGVVERMAKTQRTLTTDDLWGLVPHPREPRALGAVMQEARRQGLIEPTDKTIPSARPKCHARPVRVWRSKVMGETPTATLDDFTDGSRQAFAPGVVR